MNKKTLFKLHKSYTNEKEKEEIKTLSVILAMYSVFIYSG
jgi:hypothetical protein